MSLQDRNRYRKAVELCAIVYLGVASEVAKIAISNWWERLKQNDDCFKSEIYLHDSPISTACRIFDRPHYEFNDDESYIIYERLMYVVQVVGTRF